MSTRCEACGEMHGPDNPTGESEYKRHELLVPSETTRPAISDEEMAANLLTDAEFDAMIEREQAEADAWAARREAHGYAPPVNEADEAPPP